MWKTFFPSYLEVVYGADKSLKEVHSEGIARDMMLAGRLLKSTDVAFKSSRFSFVQKDGKWVEYSALGRELDEKTVAVLKRRYGLAKAEKQENLFDNYWQEALAL
jgi:hypothetical protein